MLNFLTSVLNALSALADDVDVNTPALVALGVVEEDLSFSNQHASFQTLLNVDIHCKAFVVGFISTAFTLLPFIVAYAGKHNLSLDPSRVVLGLAKVGSIGGVVYVAINRGNPLAREEFDRVSSFIHPYIPMVVGSMGKGAYEPVFQEMQAQLGGTTQSAPFQGYKTGLSTPSTQSNWLVNPPRPNPANPPTTRTETIVPAATSSGYKAVVVHEPPLIQVKEADVGKTVCLTAYSPANDSETVEVDIDDMEPIEEAETKRSAKQDDFEFDRDALYDFDQP